MMHYLALENLSKDLQTDSEVIPVLSKVNFELVPGSFTTLIGPSGSGKSTLLRIIAGLISPTQGKLVFGEENPKISFVFQSFGLFPYLTVEENIGFGLKMKGETEKETKKIVKNLIEEIELEGFAEKHPGELSGGMKQRVGIARALAVDPNLLLLDEPFSALDEFTADTLRNLLLRIWRERRMTVLMVTHLISEALILSDQIFVLSKRPGTIIEDLDCNLPRPRSQRTDDFFKLEDKLKSLIQI